MMEFISCLYFLDYHWLISVLGTRKEGKCDLRELSAQDLLIDIACLSCTDFEFYSTLELHRSTRIPT